MRVCVRASAMVSVCMSVLALCAHGALAQPANNTCQTATSLSLNVDRAGDNTGATPDIIQSPCSDDFDSFDVWYRFIAPTAGVFNVNTVGSTIDTTLTVYASCPAFNLLGCNDNIDFNQGIFDSAVDGLQLTAGQPIYIRVAGWGDEEGPFMVRVVSGTSSVGVCCRGTTCTSNVQSANCAGAFTQFIPAATTCNAAGVNYTPCCRADYNHVSGITVQDVFDFLTAWFAGDPLANFVTNGVGTPSVQSVFDYLTAWFAGGC